MTSTLQALGNLHQIPQQLSIFQNPLCPLFGQIELSTDSMTHPHPRTPTRNQGKLPFKTKESVAAAILGSRMEQSYCTSRFLHN